MGIITMSYHTMIRLPKSQDTRIFLSVKRNAFQKQHLHQAPGPWKRLGNKTCFPRKIEIHLAGGGWRCRNLQAFFSGVFLVHWPIYKFSLHKNNLKSSTASLILPCEKYVKILLGFKNTTYGPPATSVGTTRICCSNNLFVAFSGKWPIRIQNPAMWRWLLVFIFVFTKRHGAFSLHLRKRCCEFTAWLFRGWFGKPYWRHQWMIQKMRKKPEIKVCFYVSILTQRVLRTNIWTNDDWKMWESRISSGQVLKQKPFGLCQNKLADPTRRRFIRKHHTKTLHLQQVWYSNRVSQS